jgi:hypothetical protein
MPIQQQSPVSRESADTTRLSREVAAVRSILGSSDPWVVREAEAKLVGLLNALQASPVAALQGR